MNAPRHLLLCAGRDLAICLTCARNVDNNPHVIAEHTIRPAAVPPRCIDWTAMPARPSDHTHGGL